LISALRATAILGGSSLITILVGLVSAKAWAVLLGASGLGYMGLLQSLVGLVVMVAGLGIGPGLVRAGAAALARQNVIQIVALRQAAWLLLSISGTIAILILIVFRTPISRFILDGTEHEAAVALMGVAAVFALATDVQTSTLNAYHRVGALAKLAVLTSILSAAVGVPLVWLLGEKGVVPTIVAAAALGCGVSRFFMAREVSPIPTTMPLRDVRRQALGLIRFGMPYTASQIVGTGVQLLLPIVVLHSLDRESVGFQRAATAISVTYIGFILAAMAQDYYPRVSAVSDQPGVLVAIANQQLRLVLILSAPIIIGMLAIAPILVPLVYSGEFHPTVEILEWQLLGDLFKLSSWTMSFIILARGRSSLYFAVETIGGGTLILFSWLGAQWIGLSGIGVGFALSYAIYWLVVWLVTRHEVGLSWTADNWRLFLSVLIAAMLIEALSLSNMDNVTRTMLAITIAVAIGFNSLRLLNTEIGGVRMILSRAVQRS